MELYEQTASQYFISFSLFGIWLQALLAGHNSNHTLERRSLILSEWVFWGGHSSKLPTNLVAQHLRLVRADDGFGFLFGRQGCYSREFPSFVLLNLNPLCLIFRSDLAL